MRGKMYQNSTVFDTFHPANTAYISQCIEACPDERYVPKTVVFDTPILIVQMPRISAFSETGRHKRAKAVSPTVPLVWSPRYTSTVNGKRRKMIAEQTGTERARSSKAI